MSKRSKGESLTGGTGDVNPQYINAATPAQTSNNTFVQTQITVPLDRFRQGLNKIGAIEILKCYFYLLANGYPAAANNLQIDMFLTTISNTASPSAADTHVVAFIRVVDQLLTSGTIRNQQPYTVDVTDGAGHGLICAVDSLFFGIQTANWAQNTQGFLKILYRYKNVGLTEYIGIVQSQNQ